MELLRCEVTLLPVSCLHTAEATSSWSTRIERIRTIRRLLRDHVTNAKLIQYPSTGSGYGDFFYFEVHELWIPAAPAD